MWKIFAAIFSAGVVSLLLELSLLREFVYVIGSSAFSNSLIISVFLAGLAAGTYVGTWKRLKSKNERAARIKFAALQCFLIVFIFLFYVTKDYFIYISASQALVTAYFILATFLPSFIAGAVYSTAVELMYHKGERYIIYIYAVSTMGNVIGGLVHGYVFVYLVGIQPSYTFAAVCSALALLLVYPFRNRLSLVVFSLLSLLVPSVIQGDFINRAVYTFEDLLFRENSPFGLVEVWRMDDGTSVQMTINNVHQYYSYDWDNELHTQWAETSMEIVDRESDVLILGYGSGISSAAFLRSDKTRRVDTVENAGPVMKAGRLFFPEEYRLVTTDPRSQIVVDDFRKFIRFTDRTYDIILLDHSITDPYYAGFFTVEFYDQLKHVLKPGGVIASLGIGLTWDTTRSSFPYMYTYAGPGRELIGEGGYFLSMEPFDPKIAERFTLEEKTLVGEPVYSDRRIYGNSIGTAMDAIKPRVSRSLSN